MLKRFLLLLTFSTLASCGKTEMWIPVSTNRPAVTRDHVRYLEQPPSEPYRVIGVITPPPGEYRTEAEAVRAMRRLAAKHGADAIYIESASEAGGWQTSKRPFVGMSGRSTNELHIRAKAIVWER
jgi:hypothetical protein